MLRKMFVINFITNCIYSDLINLFTDLKKILIMKRSILICLIICLIICFNYSVKAQEFNLGLSASTTAGEASDLYTSAFVLDTEFLFEMSNKIKLGASTGYLLSLGNNDYTSFSIIGENAVSYTQVDNTGFIPLAASLRFKTTERLSFGADVGYAFGVRPRNAQNGAYFALKSQYQVKDYLYLTTSFRTIMLEDIRLPTEFDARDDNFYLNLLSLGVLIKL